MSKNNEATIKKTLTALEGFKDVVVYDNGSTDNTLKIIKEFNNTNLIQGDFRGFGWTKNEAASFCKNDWVMIIDSDEVVDSELFQALQNEKLDKKTVYMLNFKAFYKDIQIKHCGWNKQKIKRLYNRTSTKYNENLVHESIISKGLRTKLLSGSVEHYSYQSISQFIQKSDTYSTLFAKNNAGKKDSSPTKAFFNSLYSFFRTYIIKQGFRDGYAGLIISFSHMSVNFYKYMKLYELNQELKADITHLNFAKGFRGGERQTLLLIEELASLGYSQELIVRKDSVLIEKCAHIKNLKTIPISKPYLLNIRHIKNSRLLHAHETKAAQFAYITSIMTKIPYIITRRVSFRIKKSFFSKALYLNAKTTVVLSRAIKHEILKVSPQAFIDIIPSAFTNQEIDKEKSQKIKERFKGKFLIGHIGALEDSKGQIYIIEAAKLLKKTHPNLHFLLLGKGKDEKILKQKIDNLDNVTLEGFVDNVHDYISTFDLFVFPSTNEGLGSSLLDVMSLGVPIIASDVGGIPDVIKDKYNGVLIPSRDSKILSEQIIALYQDEKMREILLNNGKKEIKKYSAKNMAKKYSLLYNKD